MTKQITTLLAIIAIGTSGCKPESNPIPNGSFRAEIIKIAEHDDLVAVNVRLEFAGKQTVNISRKGGGLSSSFGGGGTQQVGGVKKTSDFLDKSTWALAALLLVLILLSNVAIDGPNNTQESKALDLDATPTTSQPVAVPVQETTTDESSTPEASDSE